MEAEAAPEAAESAGLEPKFMLQFWHAGGGRWVDWWGVPMSQAAVDAMGGPEEAMRSLSDSQVRPSPLRLRVVAVSYEVVATL
jgi:hypothetical protein